MTKETRQPRFAAFLILGVSILYANAVQAGSETYKPEYPVSSHNGMLRDTR